MGEERKTLTGMINDEHLSFTSFFHFGMPHRWFWRVGAVLMLGNMFRGGALGNSFAFFINILIGFMIGLIIYVPLYIYFYFVCFFLACIFRLLRGRGGVKGMITSAGFIVGYILLFRYAYVPWLLQIHYNYVDWGDVMRYLKVY